jgi:serine/threonine protein kinase
LNSKRALNCILQIAIGLNYIHKRNFVHQELIPDNIFIENDRVLKIGNMLSINTIVGKIIKNSFAGASP